MAAHKPLTNILFPPDINDLKLDARSVSPRIVPVQHVARPEWSVEKGITRVRYHVFHGGHRVGGHGRQKVDPKPDRSLQQELGGGVM